MHTRKKALTFSAFFFASIIPALFWSTSSRAQSCPPPQSVQTVSIATVFDGDTVRLNDGRKVRLIGINTPELGRDGKPDQPLARQAKAALEQLLQGQSDLQLQPGQQSHDRYGRLLAHLYLHDGTNLEAQLLKRGLGFAISIPPNLKLRDCLRHAEQQARQQQRGVWSDPYYQPLRATDLSADNGGFGRFRGQVTKTGKLKKGHYLELDGKIFITFESTLLQQHPQFSSDNLLGYHIEIRGWLITRKLTKDQLNRGYLPFMLNINHPDGLKRCDTDC
ncbi:MAG: thermonuclease family protein [Motiliproteus sp.]